MKIPFLDINAQNAPLRMELEAAIREVIESGAFAGGPFVSQFEEDFAAFCGCRHAIGVGSGTEALWLALLAMGIGPGDEVITVPSTFMATAEAITYCGARPVFVDIDEQTYTMDPSALEEAVTPRTKAIIPVHLFGQTADMDPIMSSRSGTDCESLRMRARLTELGTRGAGRVRSGMPAVSVFTPARIWEPSVRPVPWSPMIPICRKKSASSGIMGRSANITTP